MADKECPKCAHDMPTATRLCPKCQYEFYAPKTNSVIFQRSEPVSYQSNVNSGVSTRNEEMVRDYSNTRTYDSNRETEHDKQVLQKAMLPNWFYLGRHQFTDFNGKPVGNATYNAYCPTYNNGNPISYSEFHMLVAAIVRIVDTGNPEGKRTKQKVSS